MKRTVALAILAALLLTLCACGKVRQAEEAIDAIGNVTAESGAQIEAAEAAVEALNDKQRDKLPNLTVLEEAQTEYETVLEEQAETEACVQEAENAIDAIGSVTLDSGDAIRAARAAYDAVPEEADAVLIYSPASDLSSRERDILAAYLASGGKLLVFAGPVKDGTLPNLLSLLADYGVEAEEGMVIEEDSQYYVGYPYLLLPEIQSSGITDPLLSEGYYVTAPAAQGLRVTGSADVTELLTTSDTAYSKAAGYAITTYEREDGDSSGPFALAVRIGTDGGGEMVWVASGYFLEDAYNDYSSGANLNFTMNALSELMGESDTLAIRSKSLSYTYLTISESSAARLKTLLIGVLPGAFLLYGIFTVVERRRKRDA